MTVERDGVYAIRELQWLSSLIGPPRGWGIRLSALPSPNTPGILGRRALPGAALRDLVLVQRDSHSIPAQVLKSLEARPHWHFLERCVARTIGNPATGSIIR